ncbi:PspC domain-containing protein [Pontibacter sp. G13]|uniref:PspC domain-containing protein n=1 Tax=Pontibacter sp. G13 TaxID=3074898 RepID=UPI00288AAB2A|nr:PspC domain-containing protein [Pontibacter sp. G13]WNJ18083.1 PspC domain-containing protein [Pontibacter sp. G13]
MSRERYRRRSSFTEEFDTSLMYDDIEKIREREQEEEKDQNAKLGYAGTMAFVAGSALLVVGIINAVGGGTILPDLMQFLQEFGLPIVGFGALGYGFYKMLKLAFRQKELNFPALNVYRKSKPVPPPVKEERSTTSHTRSTATEGRARTRTRDRDQQRSYSSTQNRYQRRPKTYRRASHRKALRRSRNNRVFSGVAGGIAEYTGISAALIRFAFILSMIMMSGMPIFIYLLLSIVLPANYDSIQDENQRGSSGRTSSSFST